MSAMLDVWAATSIFMAQSFQLGFLSTFNLDVIGFSSEVDKFSTFFHDFLGEDVQKSIHTVPEHNRLASM